MPSKTYKMKQRLHKILAQSTELSRRAAEKAIVAGEVSVNGSVVTELGVLADPFIDKIRWKGAFVRPADKNIYIVYNKPKRKLVTKKDALGRPTIWDDLRKFKDKVNAVGRLDFDSEGLLILTNDGEFINQLTHPSHEIKKIYNVKVRGVPPEEALDKLRRGLKYQGNEYQPAEITIRSETEENSWFNVVIMEGKNRQIRKMFDAIRHPVLKIKRIAIGPIFLGRLESGRWRFLQPRELKQLSTLVPGIRVPIARWRNDDRKRGKGPFHGRPDSKTHWRTGKKD